MTATLVALAAPSIARRTAEYFDVRSRRLDIAGLHHEAVGTMSTSEEALVEVGIACWKGAGPIDMAKLTSLDAGNARRALTALAVRLGLLDYGRLVLDLEEALR
jgi:hypothetical protein